MRLTRFLVPVIVLSLGIGAFTYFKSTREAPVPLETTYRPPLVSAQAVEKAQAIPVVRLFGEVQTPESSLITSAVEADVVRVSVLEGDTVVTGQEMILLDNADIVLEQLQRKAEVAEIEALIESEQIRLKTDNDALVAEKELLALTRKAVERARKLVQSSAGSQATLDEALQNEQRQILSIVQRQMEIDEHPATMRQLNARLDRAEAILQRTERDLDRTVVRAPVSGRVTDVMVSTGDRASRGAQLVRLYNEDRLELRTQIPTSYFPILQDAVDSGIQVSATAEYYRDTIELELHRLSASTARGQGGLDAFFRTRSGRLPPLGITLELKMQLPPIESAVVISPDALYGRGRVYVIVDDRLEQRSVTALGEFIDDDGRQQIILSGEQFEDGELVLNSRLPQAVSGLAVAVNE